MTKTLAIGTRGSPLALAQARSVAALVEAARGGFPPEIRTLRTSGDVLTDAPLAAFGGKGLFTKEIDEALLAGRIELAVHSMKDVPTVLPKGIVVAAVLPREDVRDVLVAKGRTPLADLAQGARVGTSSLRRRAQVLAARPDLKVVDFRGNVGTRLEKIGRGMADATILARAGLNRLGVNADEIGVILETAEMLPAPAQGAIGIACRESDSAMRALLATLDHGPTAVAVACERALLAALDGSCRTPIAAFARIDGERLLFDALIAEPDGSAVHRTRREGLTSEAAAIGRDAGAELRARAGVDFFARLERRTDAPTPQPS